MSGDEHRDLTGRIARILRDDGEDTGLTLAPGRVAQALASLGPAAVPGLIEVLTKTEGFGTPTHWQIVLQALTELRAREAIGPLIGLFGETRETERRMLLLAALGELGGPGDTAVHDLAKARLTDGEESPVLRGTAALCLGRLGDPRATDRLFHVVRDEQDATLRASAVRALTYLWQPPPSTP
ncbi:HEAT repeat domain-containing protein, partial [Nonomuraea sp. K274]